MNRDFNTFINKIWIFAIEFIFTVGIYLLFKNKLNDIFWAEIWLIGNLAFYIYSTIELTLHIMDTEKQDEEVDKEENQED